jgi:hypothetical protein
MAIDTGDGKERRRKARAQCDLLVLFVDAGVEFVVIGAYALAGSRS